MAWLGGSGPGSLLRLWFRCQLWLQCGWRVGTLTHKQISVGCGQGSWAPHNRVYSIGPLESFLTLWLVSSEWVILERTGRKWQCLLCLGLARQTLSFPQYPIGYTVGLIYSARPWISGSESHWGHLGGWLPHSSNYCPLRSLAPQQKEKMVAFSLIS